MEVGMRFNLEDIFQKVVVLRGREVEPQAPNQSPSQSRVIISS